MIHPAKFGSVKRFIGVLAGRYAGMFPARFAPIRARLVPVAETFNPYCEGAAVKLRTTEIRVDVDLSDNRSGKKIRNATEERIPFILTVGGEDAKVEAVSFRCHDGYRESGVSMDEAVARIGRVTTCRVDDPACERLVETSGEREKSGENARGKPAADRVRAEGASRGGSR